MRRYETIIILDPDLSEERRQSVIDRVKEIIAQQDGAMIDMEFWGTKKLAYEIKKKPRGFYVRFDYCGMGSSVAELERFFRIDDRLMKYITVQLSADADVEKVKAELEASKAKKAAAATQAASSRAEENGAEDQDEETETTEDETEEE